jgi:hypothetical protein
MQALIMVMNLIQNSTHVLIYLFSLFNDAFLATHKITSNGNITSEWWIVKDVEEAIVA